MGHDHLKFARPLASPTILPVTPQYMTVRQVADRFGVSRQLVYNWIKDRHLAALEFPGGSKRIRISDLEAFEARLSAPPVEPLIDPEVARYIPERLEPTTQPKARAKAAVRSTGSLDMMALAQRAAAQARG